MSEWCGLNVAAQQIRRTAVIGGHCKYRGKLIYWETVEISQILAELTDQFHVPAETNFSVSSTIIKCSYDQ